MLQLMEDQAWNETRSDLMRQTREIQQWYEDQRSAAAVIGLSQCESVTLLVVKPQLLHN